MGAGCANAARHRSVQDETVRLRLARERSRAPVRVDLARSLACK
jgi:hypothetical protein